MLHTNSEQHRCRANDTDNCPSLFARLSPISASEPDSPGPGSMLGRSEQRFLHDAGDDRGHDLADRSSL